MSHPFDILPLKNGATFIFTPCPGTKGTGLVESIAALKQASANAIVTMLSSEELAHLQVANVGEAAQAAGLGWYQLPIEDDCGPEAPFLAAFAQYKDELLARINNQETLVIHCRGGTGRTGLMAAILLLELGWPWDEVQPLIRSVRPKALTLKPQVDYLKATYGC